MDSSDALAHAGAAADPPSAHADLSLHDPVAEDVAAPRP
jgi:hypothetical protein